MCTYYTVVCNIQRFVDRYVEQNDIHTPFITVRESLEFSGSLRLPRGTSTQTRQAFIEEVISKLLSCRVVQKISIRACFYYKAYIIHFCMNRLCQQQCPYQAQNRVSVLDVAYLL